MHELLKFITCGSVDDGKSTLIGHMLYDAKLIFADQEQALQLDSKAGSNDGGIDYSLLLDGLMAEREQGITIDVAYRYFTTEHRSFIVADTPGHEEYTRNMAVGASFADLAVILIDATKGVLTQTKRHTRICSLMGIRDFVFAINKMDLCSYSQSRFEEIEASIKSLLKEFDVHSLAVIPVSATAGDNITIASTNMPWYTKGTLLYYLESVETFEECDGNAFIMPVQRTCRPNLNFRGFQGQIEAGSINVGDEIISLPSKESAKVNQILVGDRDVSEAAKGQPVTLKLDKEIDTSRGCVLCKGAKPYINNRFVASLLWMDDVPLERGRNYLLKVGTKTISATVIEIKHKIDVNTGEHLVAEQVYKNEIVYCTLITDEKIVFTKFSENKALGGLILMDRVSHMTSACGVIERQLTHSDHIVWQELDVTKEIRAKLKNQRPATLWFTGLSGSGKSTIANELEKRLVAMGKHTMLLDGDNIRFGLNKNLGFSASDRHENIRRIAEVAKLLNDAGLIAITSFISPFAEDREQAKAIIGEDFIEIYISTPIEVCEKRDVKGLYKKARNGEISDFTGVSSPYEAPKMPDITIDTTNTSVEEAVEIICEYLLEN